MGNSCRGDHDTDIESDTVVITGNNYGSDISIENGKWAVADAKGVFNLTDYTDKPGRVTSGQSLRVLLHSSPDLSTETKTKLHVQDFVATFRTKTADAVDSSKKITASDAVQTNDPGIPNGNGSVDVDLAVTVGNAGTVAHWVTVTVDGNDNFGTLLDSSTLSGTVEPAITRKLKATHSVPLDTYNHILKWVVSAVTTE